MSGANRSQELPAAARPQEDSPGCLGLQTFLLRARSIWRRRDSLRSFEIDGAFFAGGTVLDGKVTDGKRAACTSTEVIGATNRALNLITEVVHFVARETEMLAQAAESRTGFVRQSSN